MTRTVLEGFLTLSHVRSRATVPEGYPPEEGAQALAALLGETLEDTIRRGWIPQR